MNFRPKPDTVKEFNGFVSWREEWQLEQFNNVVHKNEEVTRVQRVALTDISTLGPSIDHETLGLTPGTYDSTNYFGDTASSTYKFPRQHVMQSPSIRSRTSSGTRIDASLDIEQGNTHKLLILGKNIMSLYQLPDGGGGVREGVELIPMSSGSHTSSVVSAARSGASSAPPRFTRPASAVSAASISAASISSLTTTDDLLGPFFEVTAKISKAERLDANYASVRPRRSEMLSSTRFEPDVQNAVQVVMAARKIGEMDRLKRSEFFRKRELERQTEAISGELSSQALDQTSVRAQAQFNPSSSAGGLDGLISRIRAQRSRVDSGSSL